MKRVILALASVLAFAAPVKAAEPAFNWSGFYVGGVAGYGWGGVDQFQTNGGMPYGPFSYDVDGYIGGIVAGANWQVGSLLVVGAEGELGYMDVTGAGRIPSSSPGHYQAIDLDGGMYGALYGRVGVSFGRVLVYGKGGLVRWDATSSQTTTKPGFVTHDASMFPGTTYGAGIEYAIDSRWSVKAEWVRFDFRPRTGDQTSVADPPVGFVYTNRTDVLVDTVKLGVNFRF